MTAFWQVVLPDAADRDIDDIVATSIRLFGPAQARAYENLLAAAVAELRHGRDLAGSIAKTDVAAGLRTKRIARRGRRASHVLVYRSVGPRLIEVVRVLHDSMDLAQDVPSP